MRSAIFFKVDYVPGFDRSAEQTLVPTPWKVPSGMHGTRFLFLLLFIYLFDVSVFLRKKL